MHLQRLLFPAWVLDLAAFLCLEGPGEGGGYSDDALHQLLGQQPCLNLLLLVAERLYIWSCLSVRLSVRLSVCPSVRLSVCTSVHGFCPRF